MPSPTTAKRIALTVLMLSLYVFTCVNDHSGAAGMPSESTRHMIASGIGRQSQAAFSETSDQPWNTDRFWNSPAMRSPYGEKLSDVEKIAGLSKLWAEIKFNFANFDLVREVDWDSLYVSYIPRALATSTTPEYYLLLQEMCANLRDGHTGIIWPEELRPRFNGRVPIQTRLIEESVIVCEVYDKSLRDRGIRPGLEIISVDGIPALEYGRVQVAPYQLANTPQDAARTTYEYAYLRGPISEAVTLEFKEADGRCFRESIERVARIPGNWRLVEFKVLAGNVGYVAINSFAWDETVAEFDSVFAGIKNTDALIIDLRKNGGGDGRIGWAILEYLTDKPFQIISTKTRQYHPLWRSWGDNEEWHIEPAREWPADSSKCYSNPVVLLTRDRTASMAENFCVGFDAMERGSIIGGATAGSSGTPLMFPLPGGGKGKVVTTRGTYPNGMEYIGRGVIPDIEVHETIADIRAGRDPVLETALEHLRQKLGRRPTSEEKND